VARRRADPGLTTGILNVDMLWHVAYYVVMIAVGPCSPPRLRALFLD
jgi:lipooligosaccharide transport system permease protein